MQWLFTIASIIAYIVGIILQFRTAPRLLRRRYDEALFIAVAAGPIVGAMLCFAAVGVTFAAFSGTALVLTLDIVLLAILCLVALIIAIRSFRSDQTLNYNPNDPNSPNIADRTYRLSRLFVGTFFLLVAAASIYILVLLIQSAT